MKFLIILISIYSLIFNVAHASTDEKNYGDLITKIEYLLYANEFSGVVLLAKGSQPIYIKTVGYSDRENKKLMNSKNQFVIGSISKQITAALVMKEFEKGTIQSEDTIDRYLPNIKESWVHDITIHQLLTHTHGIKKINEPLMFEPGSKFKYSQIGYQLLADILEAVTDKKFAVLSQDLFVQYQLDNTYHPTNRNYKNLAKGYYEKDGKLIYATNSFKNYVPAGSFISNAEDLAKWNKLLFSGKLVNEESLKLMTQKYATRKHPIFSDVEYGYGLLYKEGEKDIQIGALGYAPGFVSASYYYPKKDISLIILENTVYGLPDFKKTYKVHTEIMDLVKTVSE